MSSLQEDEATLQTYICYARLKGLGEMVLGCTELLLRFNIWRSMCDVQVGPSDTQAASYWEGMEAVLC